MTTVASHQKEYNSPNRFGDPSFDVEKVAAGDSPGAVSKVAPWRSTAINDQILIDHREIMAYYREFKALSTAGGGGVVDLGKQQRKWAHQIIWEIARHSTGEEVVVYPRLEKEVPDGAHLADDARHSHSRVQKMLKELDGMTERVGTPEFSAVLDKIIEELKEHIRQEETVDLVKMRERFSSAELDEMGLQFQRIKMMGPTHPHPAVAPTKSGTLEALIGMAAAPLDRLRDATREFPSADEIRRVLCAASVVAAEE